MKQMFRHITLFIALLVAVGLGAQNQTSSPFSRYGYGELSDNVPNTYRGLGGIGLGMRSNQVICPSQPASFTACDSMTFMFDVAASVMWSRYGDATGIRNRANGNLEYVTLQFPLWRQHIAFSAGILPYSSVGYVITEADSINSDYHYTKSYVGTGGISEIYAGLSFNICDWVALGANIYYMFGQTSNARTLIFDEEDVTGTAQLSLFTVNNLRFRYGMQLFHTFGDHTVVLGGIFENKQKLNCTVMAVETSQLDTVRSLDSDYELPMVYGGGISYNWAKRLTIGFDYQRQCMSGAKYASEVGVLGDRDRYAFGVEYRHNPMSRKYVERMFWRCGVTLTDSYDLSIGAKELTTSIGFGFPLRNTGTVFNTSLEYMRRGSEQCGLMENMLKLTLNASINENWFFKRKL